MKRIVLVVISLFLPISAWAAGGPSVPLDHADIDLYDKASLQRGAQLFTNYCMGCHSLQYSRYERVADDLGIPHDLYLENLIFGDAKIGELMEIAMPQDDSANWFGAPPPDLTLVARKRSPDWIYTYMRSFYVDEERPWGVNNVVFPAVGMPNVLADLQGIQVRGGCTQVKDEVDPLTGEDIFKEKCGDDVLTVLPDTGKLTTEEFDQAMLDLTNFLEYVGEPSKLESRRLGVYVLAFLAFLFVWVYLLNREYWKDVH